jgi:hypothetical protein
MARLAQPSSSEHPGDVQAIARAVNTALSDDEQLMTNQPEGGRALERSD